MGAEALAALLASHGFIAAAEEAAELLDAAAGDASRLDAMVARRLTGEPLAWITGRVRFCGVTVRVDPGVYVPRWHTEVLGRRAVRRLPDGGVAVDICTGSGALAAVLRAAHPTARVVGCDIDALAVRCATANGVEAYRGDLYAALPAEIARSADVITAVVPYVPRAELPLLQRDTFSFESALAYDGGGDGLDVVRRVIADAPRWLKPDGALLVELGGGQARAVRQPLQAAGFVDLRVLRDEEGDVRGVEATLRSPSRSLH